MKLDSLTNQVYVVAVNEARLQGHEYVTPEHFLYSALMFDLGKEIVQESGGQVQAIIDDLYVFFESYIPKRVTESPVESFAFIQMFEMAASRVHSAGQQLVSLVDLLTAIFYLKESFAQYILLKNGMSRLAMLRYIANGLNGTSGMNGANRAAGTNTENESTAAQRADKDGAFLRSYAADLCEKAEKGLFDPLVGREDVLKRTIQVLSRRLKNNPVHVGDPGVGKTALVEGLAQRIVEKRVPEALVGARIYQLDVGALLAGTKYRGDFEERLVKLLDIIAHLKKPIIYIDEIHTVVGAGAVGSGGMDATAIIKPYLSRGVIRFIGSTTFEEYKKHFEKDRALARRFSRIEVTEPSLPECVAILQGLRPRYEAYHGVCYTDEVLSHICTLSARYMNDRYLPDKAVDVMDEAGVLAAAEDTIAEDTITTDTLAAGTDTDPATLSIHAPSVSTTAATLVTAEMVERTVALMAKVPAGRIAGDEITRLKGLESALNSAVFGQEPAITVIVNAIKSSRSGLNEPDRPVASFLFAGPTGVGKTEVAKQLARLLDVSLLRYDMSEYQEKHAVARLIGAPPGYVGYEEGGLLTEAVRRSPHGVLLLDEIEKAHGDILNVLLQVMDYGALTDNTGKKSDFRNIILIMTSNAGAKEMTRQAIGFGGGPDAAAADKAVERLFSPEFRNRLDAIVRFNYVDEPMALRIARRALDRLSEKLAARHVVLTPTEAVVAHIAAKGRSEMYGAREIIRLVENDVKKRLIDEVLFGRLAEGGTVELDVADGEFILR